MSRLSDTLQGYEGVNPFRESQARTYGDDKIVAEFYPTSFFWSLFNEQHEILLGTRGSGKTVLLRMLTYSCLRRFVDDRAKDLIARKPFIGFYVPLHLEFMASLPGQGVAHAERTEYFQFAFNCAAAKSLLTQVKLLLLDCFTEDRTRLTAEATVLDHLCTRWFPEKAGRLSCTDELIQLIDDTYYTIPFSQLKDNEIARAFNKPLLHPILGVLAFITRALCLDPERTHWLACIDEAEFLDEPFVRCINTFLRDEKRPLIVKMATLPFKHATRETLQAGVQIEPNGSDFNYRALDMEWDSDDYCNLTNHICRVRLSKCGLLGKFTLEEFVGTIGEDDLIDYYRLELGEDEAVESAIIEGILKSLSAKRREHFDKAKDDPDKWVRPYFHKFGPVYFVRRMKQENSRGNRTVGWFAGAKVIRRISDGNPRRFIQVMNALVERARSKERAPKEQHRVLQEFADRCHSSSEGLPEYGRLVVAMLNNIGTLLADRVHGRSMVNGACDFHVHPSLLKIPVFVSALQLAIGYSYVLTDEQTLFYGITPRSNLRLSYLYGVHFWLPMRRGGDPATVGPKHTPMFALPQMKEKAPITAKEAEIIVRQLELKVISADE